MLRRSRSFDLLVFCVSAAAGDRGPEPEAQEVWQELEDGQWQLVRTEWRNALERLGKNQIRVEQENNGAENPGFAIPLANRYVTLTCRASNGDHLPTVQEGAGTAVGEDADRDPFLGPPFQFALTTPLDNRWQELLKTERSIMDVTFHFAEFVDRVWSWFIGVSSLVYRKPVHPSDIGVTSE